RGAFLCPVPQARRAIFEVQDGEILRRGVQVAEEDGECALGDRAEAEEEDPPGEVSHVAHCLPAVPPAMVRLRGHYKNIHGTLARGRCMEGGPLRRNAVAST